MAAKLLLASVGAGKTEQALARIAAITEASAFAKVWVLLATERQVNEFRNRLIDVTSAQQVYFNVEFFTFYELYDRILEMAGTPTRQIGEPARLRLLRLITERMVNDNQLNVYQHIATRFGFIRVIADFIYELKQSLIEPEHFIQAAEIAFGKRPKDTELYQFYDTYQARLRAHDVVDREGSGWLALATLLDKPDVGNTVDLLVVDGYDQFSPLQAQIIAHLSQRCADTLITLTTVLQREHTVGRRFQQTRQMLSETFGDVSASLQTNTISTETEPRHPDLQHIARSVFELQYDPRPSTGGIRFLSAPDVATETATVLRAVKQMLLPDASGTAQNSPDDIVLVLRDYQRYFAHIQALGKAYKLPLALHLGEPLADTPPIRALLKVLTLHDRRINPIDFTRRDVIDTLRSPYFSVSGLDDIAIETLEQISREFIVTGGRHIWFDAIEQASKPRIAGEDNDTREIPPLITPTEAKQLKKALSRFFTAVTPPPRGDTRDYVQWLEELIGYDVPDPDDDSDRREQDSILNMITNLRLAVSDSIAAHDIATLEMFKQVLRGLLSAQLLLKTLEDADDVVNWEDFFTDLQVAITRTSVEQRPSRAGHVLVTTASDARGLPHKHVFILGLSEGIFPLRTAEDSLYLDHERQKFTEAGLTLESAADRMADDGLFYELISLARDSLILSRPTIKDGAPWVESHLWRATAAIFTDSADLIARDEIRIGSVTSLKDAATVEEAVIALSDEFTYAEVTDEAVQVYNWLLNTQSSLWNSVILGRTVESERILSERHSRFTGIVREPALLKELNNLLGPTHRWSASQFNDIGACPFRFFAGRILGLKAIEDPEPGIDARQLGSLNHFILERTYTELAANNITLDSDHVEVALQTLERIANEELERAPQRLGFRVSSVWEQEKQIVLTRLKALVIHDLEQMSEQLEKKKFGRAVRRPYEMETAFGIGGHGSLIELGGGLPPIYVAGYIDRIDRFGNYALVIDYKTGSTPIRLSELEQGRNFQIMFYLLAAQDILDARRGSDPDVPEEVIGGFFIHIRNRTTSGELNRNDDEHRDLIQRARNQLAHYVTQSREGNFPVSPSEVRSGRCTAYCEFYRLCRIGVTNPQKII